MPSWLLRGQVALAPVLWLLPPSQPALNFLPPGLGTVLGQRNRCLSDPRGLAHWAPLSTHHSPSLRGCPLGPHCRNICVKWKISAIRGHRDGAALSWVSHPHRPWVSGAYEENILEKKRKPSNAVGLMMKRKRFSPLLLTRENLVKIPC